MIRITQADDAAPAIPAILDRRGENISFHPLAEELPLIDGEQFDEMVASIRANGLREPIIIFEGMILDGRNRYRACQSAGVEPWITIFAGNDPLAFVIDKNINRRHLTPSQRAISVAKYATLRSGDMKSQLAEIAAKKSDGEISTSVLSTKQAAKLVNVDRNTIGDAKLVLKEGTDEEIAAVQSGEAAVSTIADAIRKKTPSQVRKKKRAEKQSERGKNPERLERQRINGQIWTALREVIEKLSGLPLPSDVVAIVRTYNNDKAAIVNTHLPQALQWLKEFSDAWSNRDEIAA